MHASKYEKSGMHANKYEKLVECTQVNMKNK